MNADESNLPDFPLGTETPDGPGSLSRWVPWAVVLICALGYRGCLYVDEHGAGFDGRIHGPWKSAAQIAIANPPKDEDPLFKEGKNVYTTYCAPCHQPSGLGAPGIAPPLVGSEWVLAEGANRIIRIVLNGAQGPITVKGQDFNLAMVPWKDALNDKQIAAVITFIRNNPEWQHKAGGVKPEEVAPVRKATADKASAYTTPELLAVPVK